MEKNHIIIIVAAILLIAGGLIYKNKKDNESSFPEGMVTGLELKIETPYAFATTTNAKTGAAFMMIKNPNKKHDNLINAWSNIAEHTEIHQNLIDPDDGKMMMRKIPALNIPKKRSVSLDPKGYHIMFINLKQPLKTGTEIPLTLSFENSGDITINIPVIAAGTKPDTHSHANH